MAHTIKLGSPAEDGQKSPANPGGKSGSNSGSHVLSSSIAPRTWIWVGGALSLVLLAAFLWWMFRGSRPAVNMPQTFPSGASGPPIPGPPGVSGASPGTHAVGGASPGSRLGPDGPPIPGPPGR